MNKSVMTRIFAALALLLTSFTMMAAPAQAEVTVHFHSFNGSVLFGRYPHTFVVFEGTLDDTGAAIDENFGFSARKANLAVLSGPVKHMIQGEKPKTVKKTNRHFSIPLTDDQYRKLKAEIVAWQEQPGKYYDLETRNCIHFVGRMAELLGLKVDYPQKLLRKPKSWLNHVSALNPLLGAKAI